MKNIIYLVGCWLMCLCASCSNEEIAPEQERERYVISLGVGDGTQSRATDGTIYGINVYYNVGGMYTPYAYGLFDDPSKMTITLLSGYQYGFECSAVKDGKNKLYYGRYGNNTYSGYADPFQTEASSSTMLENKFITGATTSLSGLRSGTAVLKNGDASYIKVSYPDIERYYGKVIDYTPVANGTVNIPLKKTYFGTRLVVKGDLDGTVSVTCKIGSTQIWKVNTTKELEEKGTIYSYNNVSDCWQNESNLTATVTLSYDSNRGPYWDLSNTRTITLKRNVMTTITVKVTPDFSSGTFNVSEEELNEENFIDFGINDEGELDITVNPDKE